MSGAWWWYRATNLDGVIRGKSVAAMDLRGDVTVKAVKIKDFGTGGFDTEAEAIAAGEAQLALEETE